MSEIQFEHKVLWNQKKSYAEDIISEYVKSLEETTPLPLEEEVSPPPSHPLRPCGQIADSEEMLTDDCSSAQVFQKITFATAEEIHAMQSNDNRDTVSPTNSFFVTWFINCDGYEGDPSRACASPPEHVPVIVYGGDPDVPDPPPDPTPGCEAGGCDGFYRPVACQPCVATPPAIYNSAGERIGGGAPPGTADVYTDPNGLSNCNQLAPGRPNVTKPDGTFLPATAPCVPGFRILNNLPDSNADNSGFSTLESWALNNPYQPTRLTFDGCFDPATDTMDANCYHKFGFGEQTYNKRSTTTMTVGPDYPDPITPTTRTPITVTTTLDSPVITITPLPRQSPLPPTPPSGTVPKLPPKEVPERCYLCPPQAEPKCIPSTCRPRGQRRGLVGRLFYSRATNNGAPPPPYPAANGYKPPSRCRRCDGARPPRRRGCVGCAPPARKGRGGVYKN